MSKFENIKCKTLLLYVPCSHEEEANKIGKTLVEEKKVACANILPAMTSFYYWEENNVSTMQNKKEALLIMKCSELLFEQAKERIKELHSYTLPCIVGFPIKYGNTEYIQWVFESCEELNKKD